MALEITPKQVAGHVPRLLRRAFFVEPEILVKATLENRHIRDRVRLFFYH